MILPQNSPLIPLVLWVDVHFWCGNTTLSSKRMVRCSLCVDFAKILLQLSCRRSLCIAQKVKELLVYMLSVKGEDESRFKNDFTRLLNFIEPPTFGKCSLTFDIFSYSSHFYYFTFLLPMMCQVIMNDDGCKLFASAGAFGAVVGCLTSLIHSMGSGTKD